MPFVVLYRWRIDVTKEAEWITAWSRVTEKLLHERGSLGSRLHKGSDGLWYSYAQWPSREARHKAFELPSIDVDAIAQMKTCIVESFPEVVLETASDFLV
jgi:quinol monooxygenase YgiN